MSVSQIRPLVNQQYVVHAYRHLFKQGLKVTRHATPARHVLRTILRSAFRSPSREDFDPSRIANTLRFLERAANTTGFEHKIVKNLLLARYWERALVDKDSRILRSLGLLNADHQLRKSAYDHLNLTLERLNESLGTCLK
ncbi:hypothetical protein N7462_004150 [Penicillium macrosclerotiorum]|uniref:uncharacterized protein n=1 Tax=Penicillium macrosclerotiorum TaxID=303699 RepID=UPI002547BA22|nr:uncharacterized protein N7462_004150 [Penicillium macrosclerotiorum]KAJ5689758.1 hypothetical protein N7462_004150 [Penicillium macrosclerotiorum]